MLPLLGFPPIVLGVIGMVLGFYEMAKNHYPNNKPHSTTVRITVGLDSKDGLGGAGGDLPDIQLFNEVGGFIGKRFRPGKIKSGEYADIVIEQKHKSNQQPAYALLGANGNAICISHITTTWPDGNQHAWMGDWGRKCGGTWYYSNIYLVPSGVKPNCLWIDSDNDKTRTGFQIHWPEFSHRQDDPPLDTTEAKAAKANYLCTAGPPFTMHVHPHSHTNKIDYWEPEGRDRNGSSPEHVGRTVRSAYGFSKHAPSARSEPNEFTTEALMGMSLVVSDAEDHSAEELCDSPTSFGPDFFNTRTGTFCHMSKKTLWPGCGTANATDNCFHDGLNQLVVNGIAARSEPYVNVVDWTSGS
ncbi:hypothetical protein E0Z10_g8349 [Xylaria hypoxylon]|uniref:Uncharacterized protein n=1 Tax=Xylaria hypoxylon TaxID=37992 RepID=A0A4Z0YMS8_9PEZI|nr:hypothetical protein E0Z10_g8349 [Xylaria hypoxylon]